MKGKALSVSLFCLIAAMSVAASGEKITVLNPAVANKMAERLPLSPRLSSLDGKTLYLVDIGWGGPEAAGGVYQEIQAWFAQNMPTVKIAIRRVKGSYEADQPELWKDISQNGAAAFIGIAG